jgi:hypothetical protein
LGSLLLALSSAIGVARRPSNNSADSGDAIYSYGTDGTVTLTNSAG